MHMFNWVCHNRFVGWELKVLGTTGSVCIYFYSSLLQSVNVQHSFDIICVF